MGERMGADPESWRTDPPVMRRDPPSRHVPPYSTSLGRVLLETLTPQHEKGASVRYYVPPTDIYETPETLMLVMEMPGVEKRDLAVTLENDVLKIEGRIDFRKYQDLEPVCTEYNVGHYSRSFTLGTGVDRNKISAQLNDRVLTLTLQKSETARPRRIDIEG